MDIRNLKTFIQIVETGSFSRAAEQLGYTQSTVSFQIRQLEDELGCRLFDRIGKRIRLTDCGEMLMEYARRVNNDLQDLEEAFHDDTVIRGEVIMYSSDSICEQMMQLNYREFTRAYPEIHLVFHTGGTLDLLNELDRNEADIIFTLDSHISQPEYRIQKESPVSMHFVAAADHPLAVENGLKLATLATHPFSLTEKNTSYRKLLDTALAERELQIDPVLETGRTDIIVNSLLQSDNLSFLPDFVTEREVQAGRIVRLDVSDFNLIIWKQLIVHRDKWISRPLRAFIDFVCEHEFTW